MTTRLLDEPTGTREGLTRLIGRTPLVRLSRLEPRAGVEIYAKLEARNPGGSVKDRTALSIITEAERTGALTADRILLDATSGNTGIAYAMIGASRGYRVRLCVPANINPERLRLLRAYGADVVLTDALDGSDGAILEARRLHAEDPDRYFYADQYSNPANWRAHYQTTAPEIMEQTGGRLTHFVAGLGTSGTFVGTGRRLRELVPSAHLISVQPHSPLHGLEGLKHMASALVPAIYDPDLADEDVSVSTEEAYAEVIALAREDGVLAGPSSGAALVACRRAAEALDRGVFVVLFPDGGERYLTERFWEDVGGPSASMNIGTPVLDAIHAQLEREYPYEGCGALIGRAGTVVEAFPLTNATTSERRRRFLVDGEQYRTAEARATAGGAELLGFYHSHPDHPAVPSAYDLEQAWPNLSYLIVSVRNGRAEEARSWRLRADRSAFDEETLCPSAS